MHEIWSESSFKFIFDRNFNHQISKFFENSCDKSEWFANFKKLRWFGFANTTFLSVHYKNYLKIFEISEALPSNYVTANSLCKIFCCKLPKNLLEMRTNNFYVHSREFSLIFDKKMIVHAYAMHTHTHTHINGRFYDWHVARHAFHRWLFLTLLMMSF